MEDIKNFQKSSSMDVARTAVSIMGLKIKIQKIIHLKQICEK